MDFNLIPEWPAFVTLGDDASGRIPCTRLEHWSKLFEVLDGPFFNRPGTELVFRGQRRHDWTLLPSLGRSAPNGLITEELAERQLRMFRLSVRGRIADRTLFDDDQSDELWAIGQHHGLQTPLLDWTDSPYVALFFAFSTDDQQGETDNPYRAIYILNKSYIQRDDCCPEVRFLEPRKDDHGRLVNQAGSFTYSPYGMTIEDALIASLREEDGPLVDASEEEEAEIIAQYICKIYIKNIESAACLRHLRKMNVHHASLFPDLIGAAQHCNTRIGEKPPSQVTASIANIDDDDQAEVAVQAIKPTGIESAVIIGKASISIAPVQTHCAGEDHPLTISELEVLIDSFLADRPFKNTKALAEGIAPKVAETCATTDWMKRDSILAALRTSLRAQYRQQDYPRACWDALSSAIIERLIESAEAFSTPPAKGDNA